MNSRETLVYLSLKYKGDWDEIFRAINSKEEIDEEEAKKALKNIGSKYITSLDDGYPQFLNEIFKPPFVLYYHGDISLLNNKFNSLAVVGARKCSNYGLECTRSLVMGLPKDIVIVSGMAKGIDACAHISAIKNGAKTIAVLGSGINYVYPSINKELYEEIKKNHLVISEYPDMTEPTIYSFPIRNRLVAALTNCCLVTEATMVSGSSITSTLVLNNGGYLCCVPYPLGTDSLCNHLIHEGACLVEKSQDILDEMNYRSYKPIF